MSNIGIPGIGAPDALERHPMLDLLEENEEVGFDFQRGDVVNGTIAWIRDNEILIDVGGKYEGMVSSQELAHMSPEERSAFSVGDAVECLILNPRDRDGNLVVSLTQARVGQDWERAELLFEEGTIIQAPVGGHNKGGLIVYVGHVRGFVPASQVDRRHSIDRSRIDGSAASPLAGLVDEPLWLKIIEIDRRKNRLILSEQAAMRERRKQLKTDLLNNLEEGLVVSGHVTSLADFGAFVDIGGADGLIHLSEISWNRVNHPSEVLQPNQLVTVKIINIDRERKRIGLSLKQLEPEPWSNVADRFTVGAVVDGTITRLADFGAFARLDGNIEGLIHVSELSDDGRPANEVVQPGDRVTLRVIRVDPDRKRVGLSLKRAAADYDDLSAAVVVEDVPDIDAVDTAVVAPTPVPAAVDAVEPVIALEASVPVEAEAAPESVASADAEPVEAEAAPESATSADAEPAAPGDAEPADQAEG